MPQLILASSSPNRRDLLDRLKIAFECISPDIDESRLKGETPIEMAKRLSHEKALKIAEQYPDAVVIGSDQLAVLGDEIIQKPLTLENGIKQWQKMSGKTIQFYTGVSILCLSKNIHLSDLDTTTVTFRKVTESEIKAYLEKDQPLNCCGGFKIESLGISMTESVKSSDPTALIGLPLIAVSRMLREHQ